LRPDALNVWDLFTPFRTTSPDAITLPQYFKNNGYTTIGMGKAFHNIFPDSVSWSKELHVDGFPFDPDAIYADEPNLKNIAIKKKKFIDNNDDRRDKYGIWYIKTVATEAGNVPDDAYYDGAQTTLAIETLNELHKGKEPFFLSIGFYKPHLPFNAPKKYWDLYNPSDLPIATNTFIPNNAPEFAVHGDLELRNYDDFNDLPLPNQAPLSKEKQQHLIHGYYASISYIDAQIGKILDELDRLNLTKNTIIVLWSDHGWKLGEHNGWAKQTNYEIDTRVPLIVSGKNVLAKHQQSNAFVELVDIFPTLCDMAGLKIPATLAGKSLYSLTKNPNLPWNRAAFSQFLLGYFPKKESGKNDRMGYTIRTNKFRYVAWYAWKNNTKGNLIDQELYDETIDPSENNNLAGKQSFKKTMANLQHQLEKQWVNQQ
jgi:iduronate 2-sulfatase